jgi:hypothetical protein
MVACDIYQFWDELGDQSDGRFTVGGLVAAPD